MGVSAGPPAPHPFPQATRPLHRPLCPGCCLTSVGPWGAGRPRRCRSPALGQGTRVHRLPSPKRPTLGPEEQGFGTVGQGGSSQGHPPSSHPLGPARFPVCQLQGQHDVSQRPARRGRCGHWGRGGLRFPAPHHPILPKGRGTRGSVTQKHPVPLPPAPAQTICPESPGGVLGPLAQRLPRGRCGSEVLAHGLQTPPSL